MRSVVITLIIGALTLTVVSAYDDDTEEKCEVYKEPPQEFACPRCAFTEDRVCGWNGECGIWFQNSCLLLTYNCDHTTKKRMMACDSSKCSQLCEER